MAAAVQSNAKYVYGIAAAWLSNNLMAAAILKYENNGRNTIPALIECDKLQRIFFDDGMAGDITVCFFEFHHLKTAEHTRYGGLYYIQILAVLNLVYDLDDIANHIACISNGRRNNDIMLAGNSTMY